MNDLTIQQQSQFNGSSPDFTTELAKILSLVAPITMSADQQTLWLASAVDALRDIRADEIAAVSMEVRRTVTRPSQIVPEVSKLVAEKRSRESRLRELSQPLLGEQPKKSLMDRRGEPMSDDDTAELNGILERLGAGARYRSDGSRYFPNGKA